MPTSFRPERLLVPAITPFDDDGRLDEGALERHADEILAAGATGIVAVATTGRVRRRSTMTERDGGRRRLRARLRGARRGCSSSAPARTTPATTIARHEALADVPGVSASLAVVPYYVRPSEEAVVAHFQAVAERSPVPLIVYNIPYRTARGLGSAALLELAAHRKHRRRQAGGRRHRCRHAAGPRRGAARTSSVLGGDDAFLFPLVLMGGAGRDRRLGQRGHRPLRRDDRRRPRRRLVGGPPTRRGATAAHPGAVRRAEPGGHQGHPARPGEDPDDRTCACR